MIRLDLKRRSSPDVAVGQWTPSALGDVFFLLEVEIGVAGDRRCDQFEVIIATPEGLRAHARGPVIADRATIILAEFSWASVDEAIGRILLECQAVDWPQALVKLQRYFRWEYEDYVRTSAPF